MRKLIRTMAATLLLAATISLASCDVMMDVLGGMAMGMAAGAAALSTPSYYAPTTTSNNSDYQAWMNYRNSGLPGASTISFEDFKRANARAAANGYQIGSTPSSNNNQSTGIKTKDCPICHGSGKCNTCNGKHRYLNELTGNYLECPNCKPDGKCHYCNGTGRVTTH